MLSTNPQRGLGPTAVVFTRSSGLIEVTPLELARFWQKVAPGDADSCWPYAGEKSVLGYGYFAVYRQGERIRSLAHRLAFQLTRSEPIQGLVLLHHCDNPPCCNPTHLSPGTQADNIADAVAKGRHSRPPVHSGERSARGKLSGRQVAEIKERYLAGGVTQQSLADRYGVTQSNVSAIIRGRVWRQSSDDTGALTVNERKRLLQDLQGRRT
jgi:hypothetical protein